MDDFWSRLTAGTERFLTWRKRRQLRKKIKQQQKHVVVDWIEAFLWAAGVVLLINQYALQAYQIPSGSMRDTLQLGDRIFVNKVIFGPELLPGLMKLPGFAEPERSEVVIFENPAYISRGTAFEILQRVLYMVTLSFVDIDRDEDGQPRAQFLIKRAVGVGGDRFRNRQGELDVLLPGETEWVAEREIAEAHDFEYQIRRMIPQTMYASYPAAGRAAAFGQLGLTVDSDALQALRAVQRNGLVDPFELDRYRTRELSKANPHDERMTARHAYLELGWYVPADRVCGVGDNRDNSLDGRYFGPVRLQRVLGRAMFKYWPLDRIGPVR
jgi:signal peptidase I